MQITFIGGGNMASALIGGLLGRGHATEDIRVVDIGAEARSAIEARHAIVARIAIDTEATAGVDVVVLAVKPQHVRAAAEDLTPYLSNQLVLSIAAGIRLTDLARWLNGYQRLVRAMPNTPALIGAGITGVFASPQVNQDGRALAETVLQAAGAILWCDAESDLDAVTAISGSGPAYVFYFMEALEAAAKEQGFGVAVARTLAYATFSGAVRLAERSDQSAAELRVQVTSKGGTTERALALLGEARVREAIIAAARAARERAQELGDALGADSNAA